MKKKILVTIIMIFLYMLLVSCASCLNTSANPIELTKTEYALQDTNKLMYSQYDTTVIYFQNEEITYDSLVSYLEQKDAIIKRAVFRKDIKPIEIDSTWKMKRDSSYQKLEETEKDLKSQHRQIDSLMIIRKK